MIRFKSFGVPYGHDGSEIMEEGWELEDGVFDVFIGVVRDSVVVECGTTNVGNIPRRLLGCYGFSWYKMVAEEMDYV